MAHANQSLIDCCNYTWQRCIFILTPLKGMLLFLTWHDFTAVETISIPQMVKWEKGSCTGKPVLCPVPSPHLRLGTKSRNRIITRATILMSRITLQVTERKSCSQITAISITVLLQANPSLQQESWFIRGRSLLCETVLDNSVCDMSLASCLPSLSPLFNLHPVTAGNTRLSL